MRQTVMGSAVQRFEIEESGETERKFKNKSFETKFRKSLEMICKMYNSTENKHILW